MPSAKRMLQAIVPPVLWNAGKAVKRRLSNSVTHFEHAPHGSTATAAGMRANEDYWASYLDQERREFARLAGRIRASDPAFGSHSLEEVKYLAFGYVMALAARGTTHVRVLDYGGNLGEYFLIAQAMVPGVTLDYHCRDIAAIADAGRVVNPGVVFHTSDDCLDGEYDVVMFCSSLQCVPEWRQTLQRAARAAKVLFLADVPVVRHAASFNATHHSDGRVNVQHMFNRDELVAAVEGEGSMLWREFEMRPHPAVYGAPEQPTGVGFVFRSAGATNR